MKKKAIYAAMLLALVTGCQDSTANKQWDPTIEGFFPDPDSDGNSVNRIINAQAAAGARNDAMLNNHHFDGNRLNSLGETKLSLMLRDDATPAPMTVFMVMGEKDTFARQREMAVVTFLKDKGLKDTQIEIKFGDNPATRVMVAKNMAAMQKSDAGSGDSAPKSDAGGSPAGEQGAAPIAAPMK